MVNSSHRCEYLFQIYGSPRVLISIYVTLTSSAVLLLASSRMHFKTTLSFIAVTFIVLMNVLGLYVLR